MTTASITSSTTEAPARFASHDVVTLLEDLLGRDRRLDTEVITFTPSWEAGTDRPVMGPEVEVRTDVLESGMTDVVIEVRDVGTDAGDAAGEAPVLGLFRLTVEAVTA